MPTKKTEENITSKENNCNCNNSSYMPIIVVVIICFLLNAIFTSYMITSLTGNSGGNTNNLISKLIGISNNQNIEETVKKAIRDGEIKKVGGENNYKILEKIYESPTYVEQQTQSIKGYAEQLNINTEGDTNTGEANLTGENTEGKNNNFENSGKLTNEEMTELLANTYKKGDENAKIIWVEYSDVECPFCKRFHQQGTVKEAMEKYSGQISYTFKHFPLNFHKNAMTGAIMMECVGEIGGNDKFFSFMDEAYAAEASDQDTLIGLAKNQGIDEKKLNECLSSGKYNEKINGDMNGGQIKFAINGTPGNLLINKETGDWVVVSGAQPLANFESAISYLLSK